MTDAMGTWQTICADAHRVRGSGGLRDVVACFLNARNFRPLLSLRIAQWIEPPGAPRNWWRHQISLPIRAIHWMFTWASAIDLSHETRIGPGLIITHGWGLVVSPRVRIGANCTLFHGVTLARKDDIDEHGNRASGYPVIEDEVWIGPHAVVLGAVTIGRGARIAPATVVTTDVPPGAIVAGNPMRMLRESAPPDVFNRAPLA